jgi:hypothetical protein
LPAPLSSWWRPPTTISLPTSIELDSRVENVPGPCMGHSAYFWSNRPSVGALALLGSLNGPVVVSDGRSSICRTARAPFPVYWYSWAVKKGSVQMKVLVVFEEEYRAYREVLAAGVQALRPGTRVSTTVPSGLEKEMARFDPEVIISSRPSAADTGDGIAWIELPTDPSQPTVVSFGGRSLEQSNPTLDALLKTVDDVGRGPK